MKYFILFCMIFCHIVDDYYLQGILASMKQKSWWEQNAPDKLYRYDYIMALLMHAFSWSFMIMLPIVVFMFWIGWPFGKWIIKLYIGNMICHASVNNFKANYKKINLITDQIIHLLQIILTWRAVFIA